MKAAQLREEVTARLIKLMETTKDRPWRRPWSFGKNVGVPTSAATGKPYRGGNAIWLDLISLVEGYKSKNWNTFENWRKAGIFPKQGSKGTWCQFYGRIGKEEEGDDGDTITKWRTAVRTFCVFNAEQCHGQKLADYLIDPEGTAAYEVDYNQFDELIERHGIVVNDNHPEAAYIPSSHKITMPKRGYFHDAASYYATLAHEICHWTERQALPDHEKRTREDYAFYELVAEIGSAYLLRELGLPAVETKRTEENAAIYLKGWIKSLKNDSNYIFRAASRAGKIVDYLLNHKEEPAEVETETELATV